MLDYTTALPDWEDRIIKGQSILPCGPLFPAEAEAAMRVFGSLRITDIGGRPTFAECSLPWVMDFARTFFGSYDPDAGVRHIINYLLLVAKKNSKSTLAAAIMLTALIRNWRESAEFLILAPTIEVAANSFVPAKNMIKADPQLNDLLHISEHTRTIIHRHTGASLKIVAAEASTVGGKKATGILVDELWQFGTVPDAHDLLIEAEGGLSSRPEGFVIYLSTHSSEAPAGVFKDKLVYFRDVRSGKREDKASLPLMYEFPERMLKDKSFLKEENWYITNPNLGKSARPSYIARKLAEAQATGDEAIQIVTSKLLNVQVDVALHGDRWPGALYWEKAADSTLTLDELMRRSEVAVVGIDGGGLDDLLGVAVLGRERGTRRWLLWCRAWAHKIVLEKRKEIAPRLVGFKEQGTIRIIPNESNDDIVEVVNVIDRVKKAGLLPKGKAIGVDPVGITQILNEMARRGIDNERVEPVSQGWTMANKIKTMERALSSGEMSHDGSEMMNWVVGNAKVEPRGNAVLITKAVSGTAKIDPLIAAFNAAHCMMMEPEAAGNMSGFLRAPLAA